MCSKGTAMLPEVLEALEEGGDKAVTWLGYVAATLCGSHLRCAVLRFVSHGDDLVQFRWLAMTTPAPVCSP